MLREVQLVLCESRHTRAIKKAVVREGIMIRSGKLKLSNTMALWICVDPKE